MTTERAAGAPIVAGAGTIQVRIAELKQLFDSMDPATRLAGGCPYASGGNTERTLAMKI